MEKNFNNNQDDKIDEQNEKTTDDGTQTDAELIIENKEDIILQNVSEAETQSAEISPNSDIPLSNDTENKPETIPLSLKEIKRIVEALLFVSDKPLTVQKIKNTIDEVSDTSTI
ncbi:hypothetical protein HY745_12905 [Candidatus Desantisbacteria bacterium]|nr:hypothetical protein [Candidatus Desantisbacteria bacterium]